MTHQTMTWISAPSEPVSAVFTAPLEEREPAVFCPIWEVDPHALFIVLSMLLDRKACETLLVEIAHENYSGVREEVLIYNVLDRCKDPSLFAVCVERTLDRYTNNARDRFSRCSLFDLARLWSRTQNEEGLLDQGAFCWSLASDTRDMIKELRERVLSEVLVRALRRFQTYFPTPL